VLDPRPEQRTVTIGGARRGSSEPRRGGASSSSGKQSWSVELACGRYFVSHLVIGSSSTSSTSPSTSSSRRVHPHDFTLFESDWETAEQHGQSAGPEERSNELPTSRRSASSSSQQPPLVVRLVCHCYDVQVLHAYIDRR